MEMVTAQSGGPGQVVEFGQRIETLSHPTRLGHSLDVPLALRVAGGPAALAGPESGAFGVGTGLMKRDVLAKRQPRRTGRAAVHAGRRHRINELAVGDRVALLQGNPALLIGGVCVSLGRFVPARVPGMVRWVINHALTIQEGNRVRTPSLAVKCRHAFRLALPRTASAALAWGRTGQASC